VLIKIGYTINEWGRVTERCRLVNTDEILYVEEDEDRGVLVVLRSGTEFRSSTPLDSIYRQQAGEGEGEVATYG
jgi:hypothetical protein